MRVATLSTLVAVVLIGCQASAPVQEVEAPPPALTLADAVANNPAREAENQARDRWRNPAEVLEFCGVQRNSTVAEIWPSGGWWTEILAPFLKAEGSYFAVTQGVAYEGRFQDGIRESVVRYNQKLADDPGSYGAVQAGELNPPRVARLAPDATVDVVLTFRNLHNFMAFEITDQVMQAANRALKPGGVLCVVDHRADPETPWDPLSRSGYVHEQQAVSLIEPHGFRLVERSEVNANPRDTRDHPRGVWTLPPRLALGDEDRQKYLAIGESDRFTMKFRKISES